MDWEYHLTLLLPTVKFFLENMPTKPPRGKSNIETCKIEEKLLKNENVWGSEYKRFWYWLKEIGTVLKGLNIKLVGGIPNTYL